MSGERPEDPEDPEDPEENPKTPPGSGGSKEPEKPESTAPSESLAFNDYESALDQVLDGDRRYSRHAYFFVQRALQFYREKHGGEQGGGHIKGPQLLRGVRELALDEFGPMARSVLNSWGLGEGEDIGEIVYNLIDAGLMSKTPEDRKKDFHGVMKFDKSMDAEASW